MIRPLPRVTQVRRAIVLLALVLIALIGMTALKRATPYGLGLTNDSSAYLGGARAILEGEDFSRTTAAGEIRPIVHFPPAFSLLVAAAGATSLDILAAVRILVLLLFAASILLFAIVCFQLSHSWAWALLGAGLFASSGGLLGVYSFALSEPLYLTLMLATFVLLGEFFGRARSVWLVLGALTAGIAVLTRYIGLSLVLAAALAVAVAAPAGRRRRADLTAVFSLGLIPWIAWSLRNLLAAGSTSNRILVWHPLSWEKLSAGIGSLAAWFLPVFDPGQPIAADSPLALLSWGLLAGSAVWLGASLARRSGTPSSREALARLLALFIVTYLGALIFSISLFDASTPLDVRVLSPVVLAGLALAVAGLSQLTRSPRPPLRWVAIGLGVAWLAFSVRQGANTVARLELDGQGFASLSWKNSRALEAVRGLPDDILLYSNRPAALLLLLDRRSLITPTPIDPSTLLARQNYLEDLPRMRERVLSGEAVLALFRFTEMSDPADLAWVRQLTGGLPIYAEFNDGTLFGKP